MRIAIPIFKWSLYIYCVVLIVGIITRLRTYLCQTVVQCTTTLNWKSHLLVWFMVLYSNLLLGPGSKYHPDIYERFCMMYRNKFSSFLPNKTISMLPSAKNNKYCLGILYVMHFSVNTTNGPRAHSNFLNEMRNVSVHPVLVALRPDLSKKSGFCLSTIKHRKISIGLLINHLYSFSWTQSSLCITHWCTSKIVWIFSVNIWVINKGFSTRDRTSAKVNLNGLCVLHLRTVRITSLIHKKKILVPSYFQTAGSILHYFINLKFCKSAASDNLQICRLYCLIHVIGVWSSFALDGNTFILFCHN